MTTDFQKELANVLDIVYEAGYNAGDFGGKHTPTTETILKAAQKELNNLLSDVIGEDETHSPTVRTLHNHGIDARNDLRATIRSKLGLTGGSDE